MPAAIRPRLRQPLSPLEQIIRRLIERHGPISIADYMALALGHPEHGYYITRDPLGRGGDFITAPEISQMFGEMIGAWCLATWQSMGSPAPVALVELGPGRGTLMADLMRVATKLSPAFAAAVTLHLVETSPALRALQAEKLAAYHPVWHETIAGVPEIPAIFVANEFFDALPIRQFVATEQGLAERCVGIDHETGELAFVVERKFIPVASSIRHCEPSGEAIHSGGMDCRVANAPRNDGVVGSIIETCPQAVAITRRIAGHIVTHGGAALVIDYGYTEPPGETLQAVRHHRYANVLQDPGWADLTAHVDFAALAEAARGEGVQITGPVGQGEFLLSLGIAQRAERLGTPEAKAALARLTDADQMGELFKVLMVTNSP